MLVAPPTMVSPTTSNPSTSAAAHAASPEERGVARDVVMRLDAMVFTGGDDPHTEPFGAVTDPRVTPVHPDRQRWESLLMDTLEHERPDTPVLAICLGMQLACLRAGGTLEQWLADRLGSAASAHHPGAEEPPDVEHDVRVVAQRTVGAGAAALFGGRESFVVPSRHRQGVTEAGRLRVLAVAPDGLIEAVGDAERRWFVGVQWHPERAGESSTAAAPFEQLVEAAATIADESRE